ncbi:hypothetical protein NQ315_002530 [Exocentrus adspersus]|uniref:RNase H type-1 domain-containing protein n=1 Tax=Exocentrus adspersus TaxID=1586481 RepID=A0AAV8VF58_9CUCU|nr:hypothetical protein NQ315_002530 [Exocentrus adspersus]
MNRPGLHKNEKEKKEEIEVEKYLGGLMLKNKQFLQRRVTIPYTKGQAEVFAILMVAQREDVKNCTEERIFICSDSQAALRAISSPRTRSMFVQECGDALESLARQKEVGLVWVPGHMGIPGNERAYQLARLGSVEPPQGPEPILGISRGSINGALSRWAYRRLGMSWRMNTGCRQAHNFLDGSDRLILPGC